MLKKVLVVVYVIAVMVTIISQLMMFNFITFGFGDSMEPNISSGSLLVLQDQDDYQKGDVVCFNDTAYTQICHRIVDKEDDIIATSGDNNSYNERIHRDSIHGKVVVSREIPYLHEIFYSTVEYIETILNTIQRFIDVPNNIERPYS